MDEGPGASSMGHRPCLIEGTFQEGSRLSYNPDDRMLFSALLRSKQRGRGWEPQGGLLEAVLLI